MQVVYFSATLDPVATAALRCMNNIAETSLTIEHSEAIVMGYTFIVLNPHSVETLFTPTRTQHLTCSRLTKYEQTI